MSNRKLTVTQDCSLIEVYIGFYLQRKSGRLPIKYRMERFTHNATLPSAVLLFKDFDVWDTHLHMLSLFVTVTLNFAS